jgi:hypoxanthine phosphoribosyltransferase
MIYGGRNGEEVKGGGMDGEIECVLLSRERIAARTKELAEKIAADYRGKDLVLVGVLKGAFVFLADLARHLDLPVEIDFVALSSYGQSTRTSGVVRITKDLDLDITGKHVLVVEDIVDTGLTLDYLRRMLQERGPSSVEICALLNKPEARKVDIEVKYLGFDVPSRFVVGYGLDYAERFRQLPFVGVLREERKGATE